MVKRKLFFMMVTGMSILFMECGPEKQADNKAVVSEKKDSAAVPGNTTGIGKFKDLQLGSPLSEDMIGKGQAIFDAKCVACHKVTEEKLVGPGWKGVTERRKPEWIMNFITNTDVMLDKDLVAQQELVVCVARMPNQGLSDEQARQILEFMRKNDGQK
jgi:mono/diheme cytochrome c family protein